MRAFGDHIGYYVDVGANDPVHGSSTMALYSAGWRGLNIEPNPAFVDRFERIRPDDTNICSAVSDRHGSAIFFLVEDDPALSSLDTGLGTRYAAEGRSVRKIEVPVQTLDAALAQHNDGREIDVLKIDVEGHERGVLQGANLSRWKPRVLVIEAIEPYRYITTHSQWEDLVVSEGYTLALFDGINRIYARDDCLELRDRLSWPVCSLDKFDTEDSIRLAELRPLGKVALYAATLIQRLVSLRKVGLRGN